MKVHKLSAQQARTLALNAQLLDGRAGFPAGKEGVAQVIETLGYVQIDTIAVIQRAQHHTLWNRRRDYDPDMLHYLQAKDRRVFEYWGHAHSYLPMTDYRYSLPRMIKMKDPYGKWDKFRREKYAHLLKPTLERIGAEGPKGLSDFESIPHDLDSNDKWLPNNWPMRSALDILFTMGKLMITERRKFQKIYDLTERVLPDWVDTSIPTDEELGQFLVRRALSAYGVAQESEIRQHINNGNKEIIAKALLDLVEQGEVVRTGIEGVAGDYYATPDRLDEAASLKAVTEKAHLLSPFDNMVIQRERTKILFDFEFTLECYVPPAKRKFGYFVLPVIWQDRLVARIDPKADRKKKTLLVRNFEVEPGFDEFDDFLPGLAHVLVEFMLFNECEQIRIEKMKPAKIKAPLRRLIKQELA